jgi:F1F0 ATPase subunit 2
MMNEMNMNGIVSLALMFTAGLALGAFYFIGLWKTLRRLSQTESRARLLIISYVLRLAVVLTVLYFLMGGRWERLAAAMVGFVLMRKILTFHLGRQKTTETINE